MAVQALWPILIWLLICLTDHQLSKGGPVLASVISETSQSSDNSLLNSSVKSGKSDVALDSEKKVTSVQTTTPEIKEIKMPETCSGFQVRPVQPVFNKTSSIMRKCCPLGMTFYNKECVQGNTEITAAFRPPFVNATFYDNCIEDSEEINYKVNVTFEYPCKNHITFMYSEEGENLYVLQNGSLLVVYKDSDSGYDVLSDYCLDVDLNSKTLFALACDHYEKVERSAIVVNQFYKFVAAIMIMSFVFLIITGSIYIIVPRFRTLHGRSLTAHFFNLSLGYLLTAILYLHGINGDRAAGNHWIQYFVSSAFMWQLIMLIDTCINVWYYLPQQISPVEGRFRGWIHFGIYFLFSQLVPILFTLHGETDHQDSYYLSTLGAENHDDQWYFFGPILLIIVLCCALYVPIYLGFRSLNEIHSLAYIVRMQLKKRNIEEPAVNICSKEMEYVKSSAKSTSILFLIQALCFIAEVISFYTSSGTSIFFELTNSLQGFYILVIFVFLPKRWKILQQWWSGDQGSFVVNNPKNNLRNVRIDNKPTKEEEVALNRNTTDVS